MIYAAKIILFFETKKIFEVFWKKSCSFSKILIINQKSKMSKVHIFLIAAVMIAALGCGGGGKAEGVYVGQSVSEFTSIFGRKYKVEKATIFLAGVDNDGYSVFENSEELFSVLTHFDNPDIISAIRIVSPQLKTEKGIGVG